MDRKDRALEEAVIAVVDGGDEVGLEIRGAGTGTRQKRPMSFVYI